MEGYPTEDNAKCWVIIRIQADNKTPQMVLFFNWYIIFIHKQILFSAVCMERF